MGLGVELLDWGVLVWFLVKEFVTQSSEKKKNYVYKIPDYSYPKQPEMTWQFDCLGLEPPDIPQILLWPKLWRTNLLEHKYGQNDFAIRLFVFETANKNRRCQNFFLQKKKKWKEK